MLKFLIISVLVFYVVYKLVGFLLKSLFVVSGKDKRDGRFHYQEKQGHHKPKDGNVEIDYIPKDKSKKGKKNEEGEYIDYEEVKE